MRPEPPASVGDRPRRPSVLQRDERGDVPMRIAPLLLMGMILVVIAILAGKLV